MSGSKQIQLSASSRGITDHFFCFTCDEYVWDCDHLIEERLTATRLEALEPSQLQSFAYDGKSRTLEIEFRVTPPFVHHEIPLPPPPKVIQYFSVPRYVLTKLTRSKTARMQERYWEYSIRTRYSCQTVRTVCRLPRVWRFREASNIRRYSFEDYLSRLSVEEQQALQIVISTMSVLLLRTLAPKRVAGLGGLLECQCCRSVAATFATIRHRNCLWMDLQQPLARDNVMNG
jgi:KTSC domain-containing protein